MATGRGTRTRPKRLVPQPPARRADRPARVDRFGPVGGPCHDRRRATLGRRADGGTGLRARPPAGARRPGARRAGRAPSCSPATPASARPGCSTSSPPGRPSGASGCSPATASTSATSACPTCPSSTCCGRWPPTPTLAPERGGQPGPRRPLFAGRPGDRCRRCSRSPRGATSAARCRTARRRQPVDDGRLQLFESVAALICELAAHGPLLIVLEDVHWADRSSRDLLRYLLARCSDEPVAVVASYRADDLHRRHPLRPLLAELVRLPGVERLELGPLADAEVGALVRRLAAAAGPLPESHRRRRRRPRRGQRLLRRGTAGRGAARRGAAAGPDRRPARPGGAALAGDPAGAARRRRRPAAACGTSWWPPSAGWATATWRRRSPRRSTTTSSWSPTTAATGSGTRCCARRCWPTCCRGSGCGCTRRSRPTCAAPRRRHGGGAGAPRPREQRPARRLRGVTGGGRGRCASAPRPSSCSTWRRRWRCGRRCPTPRSGPAATRRRCCWRRRRPRAPWGSRTARSRCCARRWRCSAPDGDPEVRARIHYTLAQAMVRVEDDAGAYRESAAAMALVPAQPPSEVRTWAAATHARMSYSVGRSDEARRRGRRGARGGGRAGLRRRLGRHRRHPGARPAGRATSARCGPGWTRR